MREIQFSQAFETKSISDFKYESPNHHELPHIVKFSGGQTSGMLLFGLLEAGILKAERGDAVIFNNTSAEHPETYKFTRKCKQLVENKHSIPFFWLEYQTYEDARRGEYTRLPSYRLVNTEPISGTNPNGYHWRGEVYEELLSWSGFVPTLFQRTCTKSLKLEPTRAFLKEWFANKPETKRLGHFGQDSRLKDDELYEGHIRSGGGVPIEIFLDKKRFSRERPVCRPTQRYADFSFPARRFESSYLDENVFGESVVFGQDNVEYLSFIGLRADEPHRVAKVRRRNSGELKSVGYNGEYAYMPLFNMGVAKMDVKDFWEKQSWDLELSPDDGLSNCVFCFLKGLQVLQKAHARMDGVMDEELQGTPCDLNWWINLERKYGRDMKAERREMKRKIPNDFIGFFGANSAFSYQCLAEAPMRKDSLAEFTSSVLPCDCTD